MTDRDKERLTELWRLLDKAYDKAATIRDSTKNSAVHATTELAARTLLGLSRDVSELADR